MNPTHTERELIEACLRKKRRAQFALYEKYKVPMYGLCLRYAKGAEQAQDFLQEGFIKAFKSLSQYRFEVPFKYWLSRVMANACISELRKKKEPLQFAVEWEDTHDAYEVPDLSHPDIQADQVIRLIQELPNGYRSVFNLYAIEGYTHQEIGSILDISEGTSRSQYARARKILAQKFQALKLEAHE
jgi:RNA polymerase sigma-70 factor (ECF subfamily)